MMTVRYYVLEGTAVVPVADEAIWYRRYDVFNRHVAVDTIGDVGVSTVFLGIDEAGLH
jgi:hypothetical protein